VAFSPLHYVSEEDEKHAYEAVTKAVATSKEFSTQEEREEEIQRVNKAILNQVIAKRKEDVKRRIFFVWATSIALPLFSFFTVLALFRAAFWIREGFLSKHKIHGENAAPKT
jgi:hypothetical protein